MKEWLNGDTGEFKTLEDGIVIKGIDWIEIPEDADSCYLFSSDILKSLEDDFTFYKSGIAEIYNGEVDGWLVTDPSCYDFILNKGKLVWKRDKPQEAVDKVSSTVNHSLHDNVDHPKHYVSDPCGVNGKTVSDGGSSSYYFTKLPKHVIDEINRTGGVEIKDIARYVYDNNADAFNIIKAQKRIIEDLKGLGKVGADAKYDAKKIIFFAEEQYKQIIEGAKIHD